MSRISILNIVFLYSDKNCEGGDGDSPTKTGAWPTVLELMVFLPGNLNRGYENQVEMQQG
jgi:hypothetical protein